MESVVVKLTEGAIKNHYIKIGKEAGFYPSNTIGGFSKEMMAARAISIDRATVNRWKPILMVSKCSSANADGWAISSSLSITAWG